MMLNNLQTIMTHTTRPKNKLIKEHHKDMIVPKQNKQTKCALLCQPPTTKLHKKYR